METFMQSEKDKIANESVTIGDHCDQATQINQINPPVEIRHCALCTKSITAAEVKRCGKCQKRAYCSRNCQVKDWKLKCNGQGHKNWCGLECGEEDLDWEVISIEGKGQGLVAKRFLPAMFRIIVDGFGATADNIFDNPVDSVATLGRSNITNHCCKGNSAKFAIPDEGLKVMITYAKRDIQPGEEICWNYLLYNETNSGVPGILGLNSFEECRDHLVSKWHVTCPSNCFCWDHKMGKLIEKSRTIDARILESYDSEQDLDIDLAFVKQLLILNELIHGSSVDKARILTIGFVAGIQRKKTLELALERIRMVCHIYSSILHPEFEFSIRHENWMRDPSSHPDYLKFEKRGQFTRKITT